MLRVLGEIVKAHLDEIVKHLERDIEVTAACGLELTAKLLHMARLDLLCKIHAISDTELHAFTDQLNATPPARKRKLAYLADRSRGGALSRH
jgi:hypothetical protein